MTIFRTFLVGYIAHAKWSKIGLTFEAFRVTNLIEMSVYTQ